MKIFYKKLFDDLKLIEIQEDSFNLKNIKNYIEDEYINSLEIYEIINDDFHRINDLNYETSNDLFIQVMPSGTEAERGSAAAFGKGFVTAGATGAVIGGSVAGPIGALVGGIVLGLIGGFGALFGNIGQQLSDRQQLNLQNAEALKDSFSPIQIIGPKNPVNKIQAKSLDPVLSSNKVSPNSVIPEVFGTFRFKPLQLTDLEDENISTRDIIKGRYNYESLYTVGEGAVEISQPFYGAKAAKDSRYTRVRFSFDQGFPSESNTLDSRGLNLTLEDFDSQSFVRLLTTSDPYRAAIDRSGKKLSWSGERECSSISWSLVASAYDADSNSPSNWLDLFYYRPKRIINGGTITVGSWFEGGIVHYLGYNSANGVLTGSPANLITQFSSQIRFNQNNLYQIDYSGTDTFQKIGFITDPYEGFTKLTISKKVIGGVEITASRLGNAYKYSRIYSTSTAPSDISGTVNVQLPESFLKIESTTSQVEITSSDRDEINSWQSAFIDGTEYYLSDVTVDVTNNVYSVKLYTDEDKTILAKSLFTTDPFVFNILKKNDTPYLTSGTIGSPEGFLPTSNIHILLKTLIGINESCEFLKDYDGKDIYYKTEDVLLREIDSTAVCGIETISDISDQQIASFEGEVNVTLGLTDRFYHLTGLAQLPGFTQVTSQFSPFTPPADPVIGNPYKFKPGSEINALLFMLASQVTYFNQIPGNFRMFYKMGSETATGNFEGQTINGYTSSSESSSEQVTVNYISDIVFSDIPKSMNNYFASGNHGHAIHYTRDPNVKNRYYRTNAVLSKLKAYVRGTDSIQDASKDFNLDPLNTSPVGSFQDDDTAWIIDRISRKTFAHKLADRTRDSDKDFNLDSANANPIGGFRYNTDYFIVDSTGRKGFTYSTTSANRNINSFNITFKKESQNYFIYAKSFIVTPSGAGSITPDHPQIVELIFFDNSFGSAGNPQRNTYDFYISNTNSQYTDITHIEINGREYAVNKESTDRSAGNRIFRRYYTSAISNALDQISDTNLTNTIRFKFSDNTYLTTGSSAGRDATKDFTLDPLNTNPVGIFQDDTTAWIIDGTLLKTFAHKLSDRTRDTGKDFTLDPLNANPKNGFVKDQTALIIDSAKQKTFAYELLTLITAGTTTATVDRFDITTQLAGSSTVVSSYTTQEFATATSGTPTGSASPIPTNVTQFTWNNRSGLNTLSLDFKNTETRTLSAVEINGNEYAMTANPHNPQTIGSLTYNRYSTTLITNNDDKFEQGNLTNTVRFKFSDNTYLSVQAMVSTPASTKLSVLRYPDKDFSYNENNSNAVAVIYYAYIDSVRQSRRNDSFIIDSVDRKGYTYIYQRQVERAGSVTPALPSQVAKILINDNDVSIYTYNEDYFDNWNRVVLDENDYYFGNKKLSGAEYYVTLYNDSALTSKLNNFSLTEFSLSIITVDDLSLFSDLERISAKRISEFIIQKNSQNVLYRRGLNNTYTNSIIPEGIIEVNLVKGLGNFYTFESEDLDKIFHQGNKLQFYIQNVIPASNTDIATSGSSVSVSPIITTTYTLTVLLSSVPIASQSLTLLVSNIPLTPAIISFFVADPSSIAAGSRTTLSWSISDADSFHVRASGSNTDIATSGNSVSVSPTITTTYTLTAMRAGTADRIRTVTVIIEVNTEAGSLYMLGRTNQALYRLDIISGIATRIGSATEFGVSERFSTGLAAIGNQLYMIGSRNDALYELDRTTGLATRVGSANDFGVGETIPEGLTAIGNQLYMLGGRNDALYELDRTTGIARRVGSANNFGVGESSPRGLTAIGNQLYMLGNSNDALYTLDRTTGIATRVGSATAFGVNETSPTGLEAIGNQLYMVGRITDNLYRLNRNTGIATRVGSATRFGVSESFPYGLAYIELSTTNLPTDPGAGISSLYMIGDANEALFRLDKNTGIARRVGSALRFGVSEDQPTGLTAIGNQLYMVGSRNDALYTLDRSTGIARRVGSAIGFGVGETSPTSLAAIGTQLYMIGSRNDALYELDRTTGIATRIGSATAFGVGETLPSGLTAIGNQLYMVGSRNDALYTLDRRTGIATRVGSADDFGVNETTPRGLTAIGNQLYMLGSSGTDVLYTLDRTTGIARQVGAASEFDVSEHLPQDLTYVNIQSTTIDSATISSFTSSPSSIEKGNSATLSWSISGQDSFHVRTSGSNVNIATSGNSVSVSPTVTTTYILTAIKAGAVDTTRLVTVTVRAIISFFTASPSSITKGSSSTLSWSISGGDSFHVRSSRPRSTSYFQFLPDSESTLTQTQINNFNSASGYNEYTKLIYSNSSGTVTGSFNKFTSGSSINRVLAMLIGSLESCAFLTAYTGKAIYYKTEDIGKSNLFESANVCGITSLASTTIADAKTISEIVIISVNGIKKYSYSSQKNLYDVTNVIINETVEILYDEREENFNIDDVSYIDSEQSLNSEGGGITGLYFHNEIDLTRLDSFGRPIRIDTEYLELSLSTALLKRWFNITDGNLLNTLATKNSLTLEIENIDSNQVTTLVLTLHNLTDLMSSINEDRTDEFKLNAKFRSNAITNTIKSRFSNGITYNLKIKDTSNSNVLSLSDNRYGNINQRNLSIGPIIAGGRQVLFIANTAQRAFTGRVSDMTATNFNTVVNYLFVLSGLGDFTVSDFQNERSPIPSDAEKLFDPISVAVTNSIYILSKGTFPDPNSSGNISGRFILNDESNYWNNKEIEYEILSMSYGQANVTETEVGGLERIINSFYGYFNSVIKLYYINSSGVRTEIVNNGKATKVGSVTTNITTNLDTDIFSNVFIMDKEYSFDGFQSTIIFSRNIERIRRNTSSLFNNINYFKEFFGKSDKTSTGYKINFKLSDGSVLFKENIFFSRPSNLSLITQNLTNKLQLEQVGYTNNTQLRSDILSGILTNNILSEAITIDGKLYLYSPTQNLPIFFLKITGTNLTNPGGVNLSVHNNFSYSNVNINQTGIYLYLKASEIYANLEARSTLNNYNFIFSVSNGLTFDKTTITEFQIWRIPYIALLGDSRGLNITRFPILDPPSSLVVSIYPELFSFHSSFNNLIEKKEGRMNLILRVDAPDIPDPLDFPFLPVPDEVKETGEEGGWLNQVRGRTNSSGGRSHSHGLRSVTKGIDRQSIRYDLILTEWNERNRLIQKDYDRAVENYQIEYEKFEVDFRKVRKGISELTVLVQRYIIDPMTGRVTSLSSNPASICMHILREYWSLNNATVAFEEFIDFPSFTDWQRFCETNNFRFDAVVDFETTVFDLLKSIAAVGRAIIIVQSDKVKVVFAKNQTVPKQYLDASNILSFSALTTLQDLPDGIRGTYFNKNALYREDEVFSFFNDRSDIRLNVTEVNFFGVTDKTEAKRHLDYMIRNLEADTKVFTITTGIENIISTTGDLIAINYNEINSNMFSTSFLKPRRNASGQVIGFITPNYIIPELDLTKNYSMQVHQQNDVIRILSISGFELVSSSASFDRVNTRDERSLRDHIGNPILKRGKRRMSINLSNIVSEQEFLNWNMQTNDRILVGEVNNITKFCLIKEIKFIKDLNCELTLIEYDPLIYNDLA